MFVELPDVGQTVTAGDACGEIESVKSVGELYSPVSGTVVEVNQAVIDEPELINEDPYGAWLFAVEADGELPATLLDAAGYADLVASEKD